MDSCPYCEGQLLGASKRFGWRLGRCRDCGSVACLDEVPDGILADLYRDDHYYWGGGDPYGYPDIDLHAEESLPLMKERLDAIGRHAGIGRLLEVGPGTGAFMALARAAGWEVVGVDPYPRVTEDVPVLASPSEASAHGPFGAICLFDVLEHVVEPSALMAELVPQLAPRSCIVVGIPSVDGPSFRAQGMDWKEIKPPEHLSLPSARGMRELCRRAGLVPVEVLGHFAVDWEWQRGHAAGSALSRLGGERKLPRILRQRARVAGRGVEALGNRLRPRRPENQDYVTWIAARAG